MVNPACRITSRFSHASNDFEHPGLIEAAGRDVGSARNLSGNLGCVTCGTEGGTM